MKLPQPQIISKKDLGYPSLLREIPAAPENLYILGVLPPESSLKIAIVGTRKATSEGRILAKQIANDLAKNGLIIVSGLAMGIDAAAHEGALAAQGRTIAVLANGLDTIYPRQNEKLAQEILEKNGAIISEYPPGTPAYPNQFLERNRIVSGLCVATIIIEAPIHSGALVTARHALDQGREVFVMPGSPRQSNYQGSHLLIRNGARLVADAEEILEDLASILPNYDLNIPEKTDKLKNITDESEKLILETFQNKESLTVDKLCEITKLEPYIVNQRLTFLMLRGLLEEKNGKFELKK